MAESDFQALLISEIHRRTNLKAWCIKNDNERKPPKFKSAGHANAWWKKLISQGYEKGMADFTVHWNARHKSLIVPTFAWIEVKEPPSPFNDFRKNVPNRNQKEFAKNNLESYDFPYLVWNDGNVDTAISWLEKQFCFPEVRR